MCLSIQFGQILNKVAYCSVARDVFPVQNPQHPLGRAGDAAAVIFPTPHAVLADAQDPGKMGIVTCPSSLRRNRTSAPVSSGLPVARDSPIVRCSPLHVADGCRFTMGPRNNRQLIGGSRGGQFKDPGN